MKKIIHTLITIVLFIGGAFAQITVFQIDSLDVIGETKKSIEYGKQYIQEKGEDRLVCYNIACRYGKLNEIDSCVVYLRKAIELGYNDVYILADEDLKSLYNLKLWCLIENEITSIFLSKNSNISDPYLAIDIIKLGVKDQNVRAILINGQNKLDNATLDILKRNLKIQDSIGLTFITNLIDNNNNNFPELSKIGKRASRYAFLLLQHGDLSTRKKYFKTIERAYYKKQLDSKYYAMYIDRILIDKGKKQKYGTQYEKRDNNELVPLPIRNIKRLEKRKKRLENYE